MKLSVAGCGPLKDRKLSLENLFLMRLQAVENRRQMFLFSNKKKVTIVLLFEYRQTETKALPEVELPLIVAFL